MRDMIFCDVDDVLVDFSNPAYELFDAADRPKRMRDKKRPTYAYQTLGVSKEHFWNRVDFAGGAEWWRVLPKTPWFDELVALLDKCDPEWRLASHPYRGEGCKGRHDWIVENLGPDRVWHLSNDKCDLAAPGRLLIDDNDSNCFRWKQAGGEAILVPQAHNDLHYVPPHHVFRYIESEIRRLGYAINC